MTHYYTQDYLEPDDRFMWLAKLTLDSSSSIKSYKNGAYTAYLDKVYQYVKQIATSEDPPLARKAPAAILYIIRPVSIYLADLGEYTATEKVLGAIFDNFTDKDGNFMAPYDVTLASRALYARMLLSQGKLEEYKVQIEKLISLDQSKGYNYVLLAEYYDLLNMPDEAFNAIQKALEIEPYIFDFIYKKANMLAKYKTIQEAIKYISEQSQFFASQNMTNYAGIVDNYKKCLLLSPEDDGFESGFQQSNVDRRFNGQVSSNE
jgi:tetratricopeptide (TPR) repeat protein